ncbi:Uncharacterized protein Adt_18992 [Abeliophyllum distichum]|uniref:Uncharacterized protein n=1 Tax=Abeliophyllum distichum TaxID=126358 RepID=A0ABD1TKY8_9LAMI
MSVVVTAMLSGTRNRHFKMSLSKNPPNTMHELLRRGEKYVDAEEAYLITKGMKDRNEPESNKRKILDELAPKNNRGKLTLAQARYIPQRPAHLLGPPTSSVHPLCWSHRLASIG